MILSVDFGTSSVKLSLLSEDAQVLQSEKEEYPYIIGEGEKVEEDPHAVISAFYKATNRIPVALRQEVRLLCYDTYSPSLLLMDEEGHALTRIVTHLDRRSRIQSAYIDSVMGKETYQSIAGVYPFTGGVSLTTLLWFMQEEPELMKKVDRIGHLTTYIHKLFTGIWAVDLVNASMMGIYDTIHQSGWSDEILSTFDIPTRWLSPIHTPGEPLGTLLPEIAKELGVPVGIVVTMGTNDVAAAHAGAGNEKSGQILNTAGSSDMVSILTDKPVVHPCYYVRNAGRLGIWQIYATTCGGFAIDWFHKEFCSEMSKEYFYDEFLPDSIEQIDDNPLSFDPFLAEDRQSMEKKKASWHGLSLSSTREQMMAALLYSMQKVLSDTVDEAGRQITMEKIIKATGGLLSDPMLHLKEDIFDGYRFEVLDDCTIRGNYVLARQF